MRLIESMKMFLEKQTGKPYVVYPRVQKVLSIKLKDYMDDYGYINEHYVVKCQMMVDAGFSEENARTKGKPYEATCLVDVEEFDKFRKRINKVIWI